MQKVLLLSHTSPPIHGASLIGDSVLLTIKESGYFIVKYINISTSKTLKQSFNKLLHSVCIFILIIFRTINLLLNFRPNIIYITPTVTNYGFYKDFFLILLVKYFKLFSKNRIRIILHIHMRPYNSSSLKKILYSFFFNNTEVIFLSNILIKDFNFNTFKNCKLHILPNFINGIKDTNLLNRTFITDITNDNVKILYLGHMIESKGFKRALVIANIICKNHPNFIFNFYGNFFDNKNYIFFNKYLRDNDLCKNVNFLGFCSNEQKKEVFFHNNLLIMPSYSEAFPLVLMESLLNGLPVVATNTGAVEEIVKEYGTLIDDINEEEIYIEQFISGIFDTIKNFNLIKSIESSEYIKTKFNYDVFKENLLLIFKKE